MGGYPRAARMSARSARSGPERPPALPINLAVLFIAVLLTSLVPAGCARPGRLTFVTHTVAPPPADSTVKERPPKKAWSEAEELFGPLFGDTAIGFVPGTGDSTRRFLGRLKTGYTADTLNVILMGDNRPTYKINRINPEIQHIRQMISFNPLKIGRGLVAIPVGLVKGLIPDLALIRETPALMKHRPTYGREHQVMKAVMARLDSLSAHGQTVAAVLNSGDLVYDGRYPSNWERFLRITKPLTTRVPYFAIAGNHERTDTPEGIANWRTATGLPVGGERLYYCFDSADGWVRFIALDSNPIVDPEHHWTRELQVKYSDEEFTWLTERAKEHFGPMVILMHHPPFTASVHNMQWQEDPVLIERRDRMLRALHEAGISVLVSGHDHAYQRALLTWPDAVLIVVVSGGAGAPLYPLPPPAEAAHLFAQYHVAGAVVKPENVFTAQVFNFSLLRLWFGGGELYSYEVKDDGSMRQIDTLAVDLKRYGIPKIDQHKVPVPPAKSGPKETEKEAKSEEAPSKHVSSDSTAASRRVLSQPPPGTHPPARPHRRRPRR